MEYENLVLFIKIIIVIKKIEISGSIKVSNMQDVTTCKLGIPKIHEIEINNGSEKWVLVSPKLAEDQESNSKIKLEIPEETGLMKPGDSKIIQVNEKNNN